MPIRVCLPGPPSRSSIASRPSMRLRTPVGVRSSIQSSRLRPHLPSRTGRGGRGQHRMTRRGEESRRQRPRSMTGFGVVCPVFSRARRIISGEKSTPFTKCPPSAARRSDSVPVPHPRSASRRPRPLTRGSSKSAHARRTSGSRSPWSAASSKVSASASHRALSSSVIRPILPPGGEHGSVTAVRRAEQRRRRGTGDDFIRAQAGASSFGSRVVHRSAAKGLEVPSVATPYRWTCQTLAMMYNSGGVTLKTS